MSPKIAVYVIDSNFFNILILNRVNSKLMCRLTEVKVLYL
jgi:hypothetical protein